MIADDERRDVARRLREIFPYYNSPGTIPKLMQKPAAEYLTDLARALGYSPKNDVSRIDFQNRLADLIEPETERTCYPALEDGTLVCSECGEDIDGYGWNYCPNCGARIEEEVDE